MKTRMLLKDESLWSRIQGFSLDAPDADFPFSKKLAKEESWSLDFTRKAIEEYKKFVYLCCILPHGASPSGIVDKVWHMHLIYTQNYWEDFCPNILKRMLHHHPSKGGSKENIKHKDWFSDTLKNYREIFQSEAPQDIWMGEEHAEKKKNRWGKWKFIPFLALILMLTSCFGEVLTTLGSIIFSITGILVVGGIVSSIGEAKEKNGKDSG